MPTTTPSLTHRIVEQLEAQGLDRNDYQLYDVIDSEAVSQVVASTGPETRIQFYIEEFRVTVTGDGDVDVQAV
ncbi:HalOD1 output domain-containing protein [Halorarum salinum]|uniref:Halobacterial output domain-containing protein n=1 Tax=Halorarum salinum TaxID=2743089 RepID=A0A7D5QKC3_9EURY|nr:HalOD1 output domain-containing protein [Halobaculum salinum]QLG62045.1 hypothetical protein HUG12_10030 [Halobaculum salinum]